MEMEFLKHIYGKQFKYSFTQKIEPDASNRPVYSGIAPVGTATSQALWLIEKWTYDGNGFLTDIKNAPVFTAWDDRATATYS